MTVWPVFGRRILARLRPEAVEVLIESLEAFPEDFHVLSALGLNLVSTGIYFYQLQAGNFLAWRRITFVK